MINVPGMSLVDFKDTQSLVVTGAGNFLSSRRVVDVDDSRYVVFVDVKREVEAPHVKCVQTGKN